MKAIRFYKYFVPTALLLLILVLGSPLLFPVRADHTSTSSLAAPPQADPNSALSRGRTLLRQGHADQAIGYLESALNLFTQSNNSRGIAAAEDALGDLYRIQGQYHMALDHYRSAYEAFVAGRGRDATSQTAANSVASRAGSTASAATETAGSAAADNGFNANLMLAKIGDTNYRLGHMTEAGTAYFAMTVKKPESAAVKTTRRLGGLGGIIGGIQTGRVNVGVPTDAAVGLLEAGKELEEYRVAIVYMTYELGMGRIAFASNDLDTARKHFQNAIEAGSGALPVVAKLGQTRRFRTAARTSLGDVTLRQGKYADAAKLFSEAGKTAEQDKRLDLMWPAYRGQGRSLWLQAGQESPDKAAKLREESLTAYRSAIKQIETIRAGSLRADESRST